MTYRRYDMIENPMVAFTATGVCHAAIKEVASTQSQYTQTEKRLYALPQLKAHIAELNEEIEELTSLGIDGLRTHSLSLVQLVRPGMRLEPEEVHEAQMKLLRVKLAANEREVKRVELALSFFKNDPYYLAVEMRYFDERRDSVIAERLKCDPATVRRNIKRLVNALSVRLNGVTF